MIFRIVIIVLAMRGAPNVGATVCFSEDFNQCQGNNRGKNTTTAKALLI